MESLTGKKAHPWLRRGMFFSHRDLEEFPAASLAPVTANLE